MSAAAALLAQGDLEGLTLRALAGALGATPMALYNHFSSKRDLLAATAEHIVAGAPFDGGHRDWRVQVAHCFRVLRELCLQYPSLPDLLRVAGAVPACALTPEAVTVAALRGAGLDRLDARRTYFLLVGMTLSQAAFQAQPSPRLGLTEQVRSARIAERSAAPPPPAEVAADWDFEAAFEFGLAVVLTGVAARLT